MEQNLYLGTITDHDTVRCHQWPVVTWSPQSVVLCTPPPTLHPDIFIAVIKIVMVLAAAISRIGAKRFMNSNRHFATEVHERE